MFEHHTQTGPPWLHRRAGLDPKTSRSAPIRTGAFLTGARGTYESPAMGTLTFGILSGQFVGAMSTMFAFARQIPAGSEPFHHFPTAQAGSICGESAATFESFFQISASGSRLLRYIPAAWSGSICIRPNAGSRPVLHISAAQSRTILDISATGPRPVLLVRYTLGCRFGSFCFAPYGFSATEEIQAGPAEVSAVMALRLCAPILAAVGALMSHITLR
jgi:hypothetical protein